ncbi:uncharacterized protein LOC129599674 [Paramacrobiotus metropolitanus]|uniref:uncharacterized protein LOC129599674 n=1 Tax=Paramacrobiotus metropolitanus TaxID=2943436 RepID=UPI002446066C|nr:uncharacterized protein LOC129599674 [Paramacrobiotus metropolitanus]
MLEKFYPLLAQSTRRSRTLLKALRAGRPANIQQSLGLSTTATDDEDPDRKASPPMSVTCCRLIEALRNSISSSPVSFGVFPRPIEDFTLYYGRGTNARQLSLHNASTDELEHLSRACDPAKFGRNTEAVLDESYRRAGKLDVDVFATKFDAERSGLLGRIKSDLLSGEEHNRHVEAELYKLNVYGKDGFFKPHKDTPRGVNMFASLVVVFPTPHEGGALVLRSGDKEWTFDSAKELAALRSPSIAYMAFYSDVEHEILPVQSGHRVTLTYNLYFAQPTFPEFSIPVNQASFEKEQTFKANLAKLLDEPDFLPKGGLIGFGLQYQYPIAVDLKKPFGSTMEYLKGSDAMIRRVCKELSLPIQLKVYTQDDRENVAVLTDHVIQFKESSWVDGYVFQELAREKGAIVLLNEDKGDSDGEDRDDCDDEDWSPDLEGMGGVSIQWITEMAQRNITRTAFVFHGNQPELDYCYGTMCLIAEVGPAGDRKTLRVRPTKSRDRK